MNLVRQNVKTLSILVTVLMLSITIPFQPLLAVMIDTEVAINLTRTQKARDQLNKLISREDVQKALMAQGINPSEAKARVENLSDAEVNRFAGRIDQLPAASGALEAIVVAALIVFLALLVTDILGYTDVFPFVKKQK